MNRLTSITLLPLLILAACSSDPEPLGPEAVMTTMAGGIEYQAQVHLEREGRATVGPALIESVVILTNTTREPVEIRLDGCAVRVDIYRDADLSGAPAWSSEGPGVQCMQSPYVLRLEPGRPQRVETAYDGAGVLGQLGGPGRYHFVLALKTLPAPVVLPVGPLDLSFGADPLAFRGATRVEGIAPARVISEVTVTNTGRQRVRVEYGACSIWLRAYRSPERSGIPVWDQLRSTDPQIGPRRVCPLYLAVRELGTGASFAPPEFRSALAVREILGDSLPGGRYYFVARVQLNGFAVDVPSGEASLPRE